MTNFEKIKTMDVKELGLLLCNMMTKECCDTTCPARYSCKVGHNGMADWLESDESMGTK